MLSYNLMLIVNGKKEIPLGLIEDESLPRLYDVMSIDRLSQNVLKELFPQIENPDYSGATGLKDKTNQGYSLLVKEKKYLKFAITSVQRNLINVSADENNLVPKTPTVYIALLK